MNFLFFDCESTGVPRDYKASYTDVDNWPRVISLAWILTDSDNNILSEHHYLVKPDGWMMPTEKFWIDAGFSQEKSMAEGIPIDTILEKFMADIHRTDNLVAHNLNFDHRIVWAEIIRSGREPRSGLNKICTMMRSTAYCRIPHSSGRGGYKWPKLQELYTHLFNKEFDNAHDALADIRACRESFFELVKRGVIEMPTAQID